jgi:hypothetical protein
MPSRKGASHRRRWVHRLTLHCSDNELLRTQAVEGWAKLLLNDAASNDKVRAGMT